ncbi:potassium/proton antiporter [Sneathiella glossodoripedis]|uniref:potassium/proton antiporter n=1 Tax=Sneathiella glossodoripedis TaxID=418853 RepID=UPI000A9317AA|nr:potassium/proton antiporter [Sneathiella glossodoripedis]
MIETIALTTLIGAGLIVISIFTSLISFRVGAPLLLLFLLVGLLAGEDGIGGIEFEDTRLAYFVGSIALAIILFDSGFNTKFRKLRVAAAPAVMLATVGVVLTALITAVPAHYFLKLSWTESLLLGAIVGSTDAAAVFFLLRVGNIELRERIQATLEVESGSNDPMAVFLTITLVELAAATETTATLQFFEMFYIFVQQMGLGLICGLTFAFAIIQIMNRVNLEASLFPIIILSLALCIFGSTTVIGGSGFLAVYVAGLLMGNMKLQGALGIRRFQDGMTWLAQITMFLMLGLLATPSEFPAIFLQATLVGLILMFIARPVATWLSLLPFKFSQNETAFMSWVGLRGAVSVLLGILPILHGMENGQTLFNAAFVIVLTSLLCQGWTIRPLARKLGLIMPPQQGVVDKVELELPSNAHHELVVYHIAEDSPVARGERIPKWARPSIILREDRSLTFHEAGRLAANDYVYIFAYLAMSHCLTNCSLGKLSLAKKIWIILESLRSMQTLTLSVLVRFMTLMCRSIFSL